MNKFVKAIRLLGIPMLLSGLVLAAHTVLNAENLAGYLADGLPALAAIFAGIHMLFMHGTDRPQGFMPAAFFVEAASYAVLIFSIAVVSAAYGFEYVWFTLSSVTEATVACFGIYLFCGINLMLGNRMKISASTAMAFMAVMGIYNAAVSFSMLSVIAAVRALILLAYIVLCPGKEKTTAAGGKNALVAAIVLLAIALVMRITDIAEHVISLGADMNMRVISIYVAYAAAFACLIAFAVRKHTPALLPAGLALTALPTVLNIAYSVIDGDIFIHYSMVIEIIIAALCTAGCFFKRRVLWQTAAFVIAVYIFTQLFQYTDWVITAILYFVDPTEKEIISYVWYAAEVAVAYIGILLLLKAAYINEIPSIKIKLPAAQPSNIERDLFELKQRFDAGEISEEEYNTLRAERLERP